MLKKIVSVKYMFRFGYKPGAKIKQGREVTQEEYMVYKVVEL